MAAATEYVPGNRFALYGNECALVVDRTSNRLAMTRLVLFGWAQERTIPLPSLSAVTFALEDSPPVTLVTLRQMWREVKAAKAAGDPEPERNAGRNPPGLRVRIEEAAPKGKTKVTNLVFAVPGLEDDSEVVTIAGALGEAAGLGYWGVFSTPQTGVEVRVSRRSESGLEPTPTWGGGATGPDAKRAASEAVAAASVPPFDPSRFPTDHTVEKWRPGKQVVFRRRLSKRAPLVLPFALLVFAGPALILAGRAFDYTPSTQSVVIVTIVGVVFGSASWIVLRELLPRTVTLDWTARSLSISTLIRSVVVPFEDIDLLELVGRQESTGDSVSYRVVLRTVAWPDPEGPPTFHELLEAKGAGIEAAYRAFIPLLHELAEILEIESRVEGVMPRKAKSRGR